MLAPHLPADQVGPAGDRFRALYPEHAVADIPVLPGAHEALAAVRAPPGPGRRGHRQVPTPTPSATSTTSASTSTCSRAGSGASARPRCSGARASASTSATTWPTSWRPAPPTRSRVGGAHRPHHRVTSCAEAGADVVLASLDEFPAWLDEHVLWTFASRTWPARALGQPRGLVVAFSGGADSAFLLAAAVRALGPDRVVAATGYSHSLPAGRARPGPRVRGRPRRRAAHARDPRDGARGLPRQRRRPLLLLQGRADRRAHPARGGARHRDRRDRHERRRRGGRLPARASAPPTSAAPSHPCATPGSPRRRSARPRTGGGCRRGTSPPPRACPRGWRTASR